MIPIPIKTSILILAANLKPEQQEYAPCVLGIALCCMLQGQNIVCTIIEMPHTKKTSIIYIHKEETIFIRCSYLGCFEVEGTISWFLSNDLWHLYSVVSPDQFTNLDMRDWMVNR